MKNNNQYGILITLILINLVNGGDITNLAFNSATEGVIPAAFADFNSDEFTDVFMLKNGSRVLEVYLGYDKEPLLRQQGSDSKCSYDFMISSVVPGDFDGDALMDVMITTKNTEGYYDIYINWGILTTSKTSGMICATGQPLIKNLNGQPVTLDYDGSMIIDLFGVNKTHNRIFYVFHNNRTEPTEIPMERPADYPHDYFNNLSEPHSHAYLDLNNDYAADLFLTTEKGYEIWYGNKSKGFTFGRYYDHYSSKLFILNLSNFL